MDPKKEKTKAYHIFRNRECVHLKDGAIEEKKNKNSATRKYSQVPLSLTGGVARSDEEAKRYSFGPYE